MPDVIFTDSFAHYATADLAKKYSSVSGYSKIVSPGRVAGSFCLQFDNTFTTERTALVIPGGNRSTVYVEAGMRVSVTPGNDVALLLLRDGNNTQVDLRWTSSGELRITRNGTSLGVTTGLALLTNTWYHIGLMATIHASAGAFELRVNGITRLSATGQNTQATGNAWVSQVAFGNLANFNSSHFADFIVSTDGFCGDCVVKAILPQGAGNYSQWTPSTGSGWQCVDEAAMNNDTDYVESGTTGRRNSYDFAPVGVNGTVKAVQRVTTVRKDDAGSRAIKQFTRISGTDYDGPVVSVTDSYVMQCGVMPVNPATGAEWSIAEIDAAEFGTVLFT